MSTADETEAYLDSACQRIVTAMAAARVMTADEDRAVILVQEALAGVWPELETMIGHRLPEVPRIFTAAQLRKLLAEFAVDILATQTHDFLRAVGSRRRKGDR